MNDFCVFLPVDYDGHPGRWRFLTEALANRLTGKSKVLCVNRPVCPIVTTIRHREKLGKWFTELVKRSGHVHQITGNMFVFTPFVFLHDQLAEKLPVFVSFNRKLLKLQLNRILNRWAFHMSHLTAVVFTPYQKDYVGLIGEKSLIYDCYDEYLSPDNFRNSEHLRRLEAKDRGILKKASIVFAASEHIAEKRRQFNKNIYFLPNAVDCNHFKKTLGEDPKIPSDISHIPHPVIGFTGSINQSIDFNLLTFLAQSRPEWSIVLVGALNFCESGFVRSTELRKARACRNIYFIGERSYEQIPKYLKAFDVCFIPYKDTEFNRKRSPLKLYEYMASGKPIVSAPVYQCERFKETIRIAESPEDFLESIEKALLPDNKTAQINLLIAEENSWEKRADRVLEILAQHAAAR